MTYRWRSASLRTQLVAIMTVLMVVTVSITGLATINLLRDNLIDGLDTDIDTNKQQVANSLFHSETRGDESLLRYYGLLADPDGAIRKTSYSATARDTPDLTGFAIPELAHETGAITVPGTAPKSSGWRVQAFTVDNGGFVVVALPMYPVDVAVEQTANLMFSIGLLSTFIASGIAYLAVTRQFQPLRRVEQTAAAIAAGDLSRRVKVENPSTEVGRLSRSLNAMLSHIESAFSSRTKSEKKMRRFVADASHELRTPLVTIRGFSELYRHGGIQEKEDIDAAMGRIESEAKRMGQLVEDLLMLARMDEQRKHEVRPVDLMLLGNDAALDARASAPDRKIRVIGLDGGAPASAPTTGDEAQLRQVIGNLMTNALRYTPAGSPLEIAVGIAPVIDDRMDSVIEVRDHGPGISDEDASRVFERFYRADSSRQRGTGGTGLGLAIVAAIVAQHDGSVRLTETDGGGATMSIRLPYTANEDSADN